MLFSRATSTLWSHTMETHFSQPANMQFGSNISYHRIMVDTSTVLIALTISLLTMKSVKHTRKHQQVPKRPSSKKDYVKCLLGCNHCQIPPNGCNITDHLHCWQLEHKSREMSIEFLLLHDNVTSERLDGFWLQMQHILLTLLLLLSFSIWVFTWNDENDLKITLSDRSAGTCMKAGLFPCQQQSSI